MKTKKMKSVLKEVADVNGSKVVVENGEVKTILSESILQKGYMSVEEAKQLTIEKIRQIYMMKNGL